MDRKGGTMYTKLLMLQKPARLTCVWAPTGNDRMPLACAWVEANADGSRKAASSSNDETGGMLLCA